MSIVSSALLNKYLWGKNLVCYSCIQTATNFIWKIGLYTCVKSYRNDRGIFTVLYWFKFRLWLLNLKHLLPRETPVSVSAKLEKVCASQQPQEPHPEGRKNRGLRGTPVNISNLSRIHAYWGWLLNVCLKILFFLISEGCVEVNRASYAHTRSVKVLNF